ncbi:oligoendopeptidase F [Facklamia sp. DSM 111018]|uniref:Oligopeptidase F n=1 Tax=Facklamia lactis TaxID=2749967 RepID=A0ABS0LRP7_9LACT|nr:oligoendopeptidase F [Facklamia lactis]MBG9986840.1 oligoendopeptidase F [Facklamia lactis]
MNSLPMRSELNQKELWDLSLLYANQQEFEEAIQAYLFNLDEIIKYRGKLGQAENLYQVLVLYESMLEEYSKIWHYGSLGYEVDRKNQRYEHNVAQVEKLADRSGEILSFILVEIAGLDHSYLVNFMNSEQGKDFQHYIEEILYQKKNILSLEMEELLKGINSQLFNQYRLYTTMMYQDLKFDSFEVNGKTYPNTFAEFEGEYEVHSDPAIRKAAWESFHNGLSAYQFTAANNYISHVQTEKQISKIRGFDSVIDYLLFEQKVNRKAYDQQIDVIMKELSPVMQRYATILQENHELESMSLADIKTPFYNKNIQSISIAESRRMIEEAVSVLGDEYLEIVQKAFDQRWIDYPMNQSKTTGGFCSTVYQGPAYILLNWTGLLNEVLVLAHELGHAAHFCLSYKNQLALTPSPSMYFVEAPSTANEVIMCQYLMKQDIDETVKKSLIAEFISRTYFHNMVTHLLEAHFQRKVYQAIDDEQLLNAETLNQFFYDTLKEFWGDKVTINPGAELTWMRQPHYFMGLYSYTYSAGLTIGTQVGNKIASGDQDTINKWLQVLEAGGSMGPLELAKAVGVDMEKTDALRETIDYVQTLVDQLAK